MNRVPRIKKTLDEVPQGTLFIEEDSGSLLGLSTVYIKQINPGEMPSMAQIVHYPADQFVIGRAVSLENINGESLIRLVELTELQGIIPIVSYERLEQFLASQRS